MTWLVAMTTHRAQAGIFCPLTVLAFALIEAKRKLASEKQADVDWQEEFPNTLMYFGVSGLNIVETVASIKRESFLLLSKISFKFCIGVNGLLEWNSPHSGARHSNSENVST